MLLPLLQNNVLGSAATLVEVPDVVGDAQAAATAELQALLFVVAVVLDYSSTVPAGNVISQSPTGGTMALEGSTVTITCSLGPRTNSGAGRPRRGKRRRYTIRIDGKIFEADNEAQAIGILERAQVLAETAANNRAEEIVKRALPKATSLGKVRPISIKSPTVTASDELAAAAQAAQAAIDAAYANASAAAELRLMLALQAMQDDDEDVLMLLH